MNTRGFMELTEFEQAETNGGFAWLAAGAAIVVGVIVNEVVERTTGSDIPTHIGNGLDYVGDKLNDLGEKIQRN